MVDELGLEPGEPLQSLERRILAHDPTLDAPGQRARPADRARDRTTATRRSEGAAASARRSRSSSPTSSGSAALVEGLDPESIHDVQRRFFETTADVLERHGGTVEKYIGDAAMAVFGVPVVHEDDALRAVRAAAELRDAVAGLSGELERDLGLSLSVRVAVNTGEVVTGLASARQSLASGNALIVAARLEQAAGAGEILLGPDTYRLVEHAVRAEQLEPLAIKGRSETVAAWRLIELTPHVPLLVGPTAAPLVGRVQELAALRDALARAIDERACRLCTIVGPPGIGKSRLVRELVDSVDDALVLVGRCLPYGEGVTFWPLSEIVRQVAGAEPLAAIAELLEDDERAALIAIRSPTPSRGWRCLPGLDPTPMGWKERDLVPRRPPGPGVRPNGNAGPPSGPTVGSWAAGPTATGRGRVPAARGRRCGTRRDGGGAARLEVQARRGSDRATFPSPLDRSCPC